MSDKSANKKPVAKFRVGFVTASVWENESNGVTFYACELQRTYRDDHGNYGNTPSLSYSDLPQAIRALERARDWIEAQA